MSMQSGMQVNFNVLRVSKLLMGSTTHGLSGYDVARRLDMKVTTARSILWRLEEADWLHSFREREDTLTGRTPRRLYRPTEQGYASMAQALRALNGSS